ncbi:hypothetical protein [Streptomyces sp. JV184]|uniref:hypothetical protein n=1 Tax=Streptomyces sp. JV184 TaxID=858637 RepID=UPI002E79B846|nr:hypothetical protein [Streptomyces sp. JV184]MEE1744747.1 hypothetical protein [Streptomyces sp. JV184]
MTTRRARRTVRSAALVAVAAAAVLSLTACQSGGNGTAAGSEKARAGAGARTVTSAAYRTTAETAETAKSAQAKAGYPVRTQTLVDGSKAEIYELGDQHYRVKIVSRGSVLATLETKGADAGLDANDMFVVLTLGGEVHSWMGGGHTGPGTFKLAGGWTAKVTKTGELRYRAQIIGHDGSVDATIEANQHDVGLDANGVYIVLSAGGVISSHA